MVLFWVKKFKHDNMTKNVTKYFLKYKLITVFFSWHLTSMAEFVTISKSQNSSQFNSIFKNFRKPGPELKDKVR